MKLNLRKMPIFILSLKDEPEKRAFMSEQLNELGLSFSFVDGVRCNPKSIGCALAHLKAVLIGDLKPPFLILEDDAKFVEDKFQYEFEVPDETDALYLGHSSFGLRDSPDQYGLRWGEMGNVKYENYSDEYIRVHNMLARHAIVYVSHRFHQIAIEAGFKAIFDHDFTIPGDMMYAEEQTDQLVLATSDPICFQASEYGGVQGATRRSIREFIEPMVDH